MNYSKAPYNFIPLSNRILERYSSTQELPSHGEIIDGTYTGTIEYTFRCESDVILSDGHGKFFANNEGKYAIPGSSIRGMIRNNSIVLGLSSVINDIEDKKLLYRRFASGGKENCKEINKGPLNKEYKDRLGLDIVSSGGGKRYSVLKNVRAGYIRCVGLEEYRIIPAQKIKNNDYFRIAENDLKHKANGISEINYMHFNKNGKKSKYTPYTTKVSFDLNENLNCIKSIKKIGLKYSGTLMNSGFMHNKKAHYLINEKDENAQEIELSIDDIRAYKNDYVRCKKKDTYYELPNRGEEKAIFYAEYNNKMYFGFTPFLRIFYDKSIHDGIPESHKENIIDYNKALFGYANKENAYKSRLSFRDAVINGQVTPKTVSLGLTSPKETCVAHYIEQDKKDFQTYNSDEFRIRGVKFYWLKKSKQASINDKMNSNEQAIKSGAEFTGKINFNNLYEDELGLLLYSLCLKDGCYQQIGKGKPYGYGRVSVNNVKVKVQDFKIRYSFVFKDSSVEIDKDKLIEAYKNYAGKRLGINIEDYFAIKTLFIAKSFYKNSSQFNYLELKDFKNYNPLPNAEHIFKNLERLEKN